MHIKHLQTIEGSDVKYVFGEVIDKNGYERNINFTLSIEKVKKSQNSEWMAEFGKILLRCKDCDSLKIGSNWIIKNNLSQIQPPGESYLPDYRKYYNNNGIYLQQYIQEKDLIEVSGDAKSIFAISAAVNSQFKSKLKSHLETESFGIANALVLGNKSAINEETRELYARSGIMHILAVSGLHVGIVYLILQALFGFLKRKENGKKLFVFITITLLWSYAFITGLSVSVIRASIMFSLFLLSPLIERKNHVLNSAVVSAIVMLIYNPNWLFDIGFQLSYAAVFSIILFYHSFYNLFIPANPVSRFFWQITCISIAVQIGTFPITIYYFHHFQPYFIIYNLLAIPFAFATLLLGLLFILTIPIRFISEVFAFLLNQIIKLFNTIVAKLYQTFPGTNYIQIEAFEVFLFTLIVFAIFGFIYRKKLGYFAAFVACLSVITFFHLYKNRMTSLQVGIKNYDYPSQKTLVYAGRKYHWIHASDNLKNNYKSQAFLNYMKLEEMKSEVSKAENEDFELLVSHGKSILLLKNTEFIFPDGFQTDYLILPEKSPKYIREYYSQFTKNLVSK